MSSGLRLARVDLRDAVARRREVLARARQNLLLGMRSLLREERSGLEIAVGKVNALSPLSILQRGYAICRDEAGAILKDSDRVSPGARVDLTLARGELNCRVEAVRTIDD